MPQEIPPYILETKHENIHKNKIACRHGIKLKMYHHAQFIFV